MADVYEKTPADLSGDLDKLPADQLLVVQTAAAKLMARDEFVLGTFNLMVFCRRLYLASWAAMRRELVDQKKGSQHVEALYLEKIQHLSQQPFARQELLDAVPTLVIPWLHAEIAGEQQREAANNRQAERDYETTRRLLPYRLPWPIFDKDEDAGGHDLPRDRSLIIAGNSAAVRILLQQVSNFTQARRHYGQPLVVCRMVLEDKPQKAVSRRQQGQLDYFEISADQWVGKLSNQAKATRLLNPWLRYSKRHRIDMLIVDDLARLAEPLSSAVHPAYHLNEMQKILRRWCNSSGAFLIAGAPQGEAHEPPDWGEQGLLLATHAELRLLRVFPGPEIDGQPRYHLGWEADGREIVAEPNIFRGLIDNERNA